MTPELPSKQPRLGISVSRDKTVGVLTISHTPLKMSAIREIVQYKVSGSHKEQTTIFMVSGKYLGYVDFTFLRKLRLMEGREKRVAQRNLIYNLANSGWILIYSTFDER